MKISILIPVYNTEKYLRQCLDSVLSQKLEASTVRPEIELIVVDDGATDGSPAILRDYRERFENRSLKAALLETAHVTMKVIQQENSGLVIARRTAIKQAAGEWFLFLDSDDVLEPDALDTLIRAAEAQSDTEMFLFNAVSFEDSGEKKPFFEHVFKEGSVGKAEIIDTLILSYKINAMWCKMVRRDIVDIETDYSSYADCSFGEDLLQTMPMVIKAERFIYLDKDLYGYRLGSGMTFRYRPKFYDSYRKVNLRIRQLLNGSGLIIPELTEKCSEHLLIAAYGAAIRVRFLPDKAERRKILLRLSNDDAFRAAWQSIKGSNAEKALRKQEKLVLWLLYSRLFPGLELLYRLK